MNPAIGPLEAPVSLLVQCLAPDVMNSFSQRRSTVAHLARLAAKESQDTWEETTAVPWSLHLHAERY